MAAIGATDVLAIAPELSKLDDEAMQAYLDYANSITGDGMCESEDSPTLRLVRLYMVGHLGSLGLRARTGAAGPLVSESAGALRRSYGTTALGLGSGGTLGATMYGQNLIYIINQTCAHTFLLL